MDRLHQREALEPAWGPRAGDRGAAPAELSTSGLVKERVGGFDLLRFFAAYGIVLFHVYPQPSRTFGATSLLIFFLLFFVLQSRRPLTSTFVAALSRGSRQLLLPWLVWSAIYLAASLYLHRNALSGMSLPPNWPVVGSSLHLWFLAFAFIAQLILWPIRFAVERATPRTRFTCITVCSTLAVAALPALLDARDWGFPFRLWWFGMPAMLIGLAMASALQAESATRARSQLLFLAVAVSAGCALAWQGLADVAISYASTTWLVVASLAWPIPAAPWMRKLGTATLGIYLLHPLLNLAVIKFAGMLAEPVLRAQIVFVLALAAALVLGRVPLLAAVLGGPRGRS